MTTATLRAMTTPDLDAVLVLELEQFGEEAWSRRMLEGELAQQPASRHYLVAELDGSVVGYAGLLAAGTQADVVTIAVTTAEQGHGTGAALLGALLAEARRRRCREVFLEVRVDNLRAQGLYRSRGFEQVGIRRGYYQPSGADALVMRLDLAAASGPAASGPAASGPAASGPAAPGPAASGPAAPGPAASGPAASGPAAGGAR